ncbi:MFS transporter [Streptomyces sp. NPDC047043]|uniref:MFS transporter n=1 Tax=Streptomyces sp. NPDC047043 TaxID=3154497 RepID=UPI0033F64B88
MRTWGPLTAVCLSTFMLLLDVTIAVVALPDMAGSLHASLSDLQWVMDGYALALAALLLGTGAAADILGRRRVHVVGVVVFATASLLCGLASGPGMLVAARCLQGLGGAAMLATTLPLLGSVYQGERRSVALGVWGAVSGAAAAVGPVLGGVLTDGRGWRWIFYVNLPVSVAAVWLTLKVVPESHGSHDVGVPPRERSRAWGSIDWAGTVTFAVFAGGLTYGAVRAGERGWGGTGTLVVFAAAAVALVCFVAVERRGTDPLLDPRLFLDPRFSVVMLGALAFNAGAFGLMAYDSIWMQSLLGLSPVRGGAVFLWMSLSAFVVAAVGGRLLHGVPPRITVGGGLLLVGSGQFCMAVLDTGSTASVLAPGLVLVGVGTGLVSPGIAGAALAAVPPERAGMAGGAVNTFRQLGLALGIAVYGTVLTSRMQDTLPHDAAHALAGGAAGALRGAFSDHALRAAFASGLNTAAVVAGLTATAAGALVVALVRPVRATGTGVTESSAPALTEEATAPRG